MNITFSNRVLAAEESQTLAISNRAKQMKKSGVDVISLSTGEPDFPTPDSAKNAAINAINENFTHYTESCGISELRECVAEKFRRENGLTTATADTVMITSGAKQALMCVLMAICNEGDEVIVPAPYWVSYPAMTRIAGGTPIILDCDPQNHFKPTPDQIARALTPRTKCIVFNSPNNPTGSMTTPAEFQEYAEVLADSDCIILSDEIYEKLTLADVPHCSPGAFEQLRGRVATVNGVSKAYSMTGWRIGFLHAQGELFRQAAKIQSQMTTHPSSIAQRAALAALQGASDDVERMRKVFVRRRELIMKLLGSIPSVRFVPPDGAFYLWLDVRELLGGIVPTSAAFCEFLLEKWLLALVPGEAFGAPGYIRFSFAASETTIQEACRRFSDAVHSLQQ